MSIHFLLFWSYFLQSLFSQFSHFFSSKASTAISFNRISIGKSKILSNYRKDTRAGSQWTRYVWKISSLHRNPMQRIRFLRLSGPRFSLDFRTDGYILFKRGITVKEICPIEEENIFWDYSLKLSHRRCIFKTIFEIPVNNASNRKNCRDNIVMGIFALVRTFQGNRSN